MMMKKLEKQASMYTINMAMLEGDGSFQCPRCGKSISPDDDPEDNYEILDTKCVNEELAELVISCAKCKSAIKLTGFQDGLHD
jgi:hypothetical protein